MELRRGTSRSPDSTQDSTEQQQQHPTSHHPHLQSHHPMGSMMEESSNARHHLGCSSALPSRQEQQNLYQQQQFVQDVKEEESNMVIASSSVFPMEHFCWPSDQLMESMSPESADLCRNLSSQLEHLHSSEHHLQHHVGGGSSSSSSSAYAVDNKLIAIAAPLPDVIGGSGGHHPQSENEMLKAAIVSHPHYAELVMAHMNCHKVGASPEVASQIDEMIQNFKDFEPPVTTSLGVNPELDQFMVSYYSMLLKYEKEIRKTFKEAVTFCKKLEQQLQVMTNGSIGSVTSVESDDRNEGGYDSSDEEDSSAEVEVEVDPMAKDKELKEQLMRKYSGYITSLKHEFLKKKKKGKLPKDSRQQLLNWWAGHYKWPYPSEAEKASLAESTGLDQKQINNWFINQRKRHWKPSDEGVQAGSNNAEVSS